MALHSIRLAGLGHCLPEAQVSNRELANLLGQAPEELMEQAGIENRRFAAEGVGAAALAAEAATSALQEAGSGAESVEFIIFATMSPDFAFPGGGCLIQDKLGCATVGAVDIRAQCTGFLQALLIADQFIASGTYGNVLVVGSEVLSSYLDPGRPPVEVAGCFADGAGAMLLTQGDDSSPQPLPVVLHTDATELEDFWCEFPASRNFPLRMVLEQLHSNGHLPKVRRQAILKRALIQLPQAIAEVLAKGGVAPQEVDKLLIQVLDTRTAEEIGLAAGFSAGQIVVVGEGTGTVGAAALPVALDLHRKSGCLTRGNVVCLAACGAGFNWGAALLQL